VDSNANRRTGKMSSQRVDPVRVWFSERGSLGYLVKDKNTGSLVQSAQGEEQEGGMRSEK
jgi:hypothetical protein